MKKTSKEKQKLEAFVRGLDGIDGWEFAAEVKFHDVRKWRFDWVLVRLSEQFGRLADQIAIEYEGGVFTGGGHTRGVIYSGNAEKYNEAALIGWTVLRFTAPMVRAGLHENQIMRALGVENE